MDVRFVENFISVKTGNPADHRDAFGRDLEHLSAVGFDTILYIISSVEYYRVLLEYL